ncbi:MAG TPA: bifunctional serine/threonine protein kinase/MFS transporter [Drouetiella sp.]|jgi:tRNA A-37 threonylcarbamoyl transferase component Bud32
MTTDESIKLKHLCPRCGKAVGDLGSMTHWLFRETRCDCEPEAIEQYNEQPPTQPKLVRRDSLRIIETVGAGGMGTVYKVFDEQLGKEFALKVLRRELVADKFAIKRFRYEARAAMQLTHPNIAACYAQGMTEEGMPFLLMDLIDGENLAEVLSFSNLLESSKALEILIQVTEAVEYAHSKGVVHRDIKPDNVLLTHQAGELIKLIDFGVARLMPEANANKRQTATQTGEIIGSPDYMSPEQCLGEATDYRTDIYSLGCLAYFLVTGKPPFQSTSAIKTIVGHISESAPPLQPVTPLSLALEKVIKVALQKKPHWRYQSATAMLEDLKAVRDKRMPTNAERLLAQIDHEKDTLHFFPGTGLPKAESGIAISGAAVACCALGTMSAAALTIGTLLVMISLVAWYRYVYQITREAKAKEIALCPNARPSLSPAKAVWLSIACTNGQVVLGTVFLVYAGITICWYFLSLPLFTYLKTFGNAAITASGPIVLVIFSVAFLLGLMIGYSYLVVWLNNKQFQSLARVFYPEARFDRIVDRLCWQLGFSFLLTPLGFVALFSHSQIGMCIGVALPALNCLLAFWLTGKLLHHLDTKLAPPTFNSSVTALIAGHFD